LIQIFLLGDEFRGLYSKKRFQGLFDIALFSVGASHFMGDEDIGKILSPNAYIAVENAK